MGQSLRSEGITRGLLLDHLISECGCTVKRNKVSNAMSRIYHKSSLSSLVATSIKIKSSFTQLGTKQKQENRSGKCAIKLFFNVFWTQEKKKPSYVLLTHSFTHSLY